MLVVTFATAATLDFRMTVIAFRVRGTLVMLLAFGPTIVVISTLGTGFRLALLLAWRTLLFRKLSGLLFSRLPAIVGIAVITVVPTLVRCFALFIVAALLLMQARVLFTTFVVALLEDPQCTGTGGSHRLRHRDAKH